MHYYLNIILIYHYILLIYTDVGDINDGINCENKKDNKINRLKNES